VNTPFIENTFSMSIRSNLECWIK